MSSQQTPPTDNQAPIRDQLIGAIADMTGKNPGECVQVADVIIQITAAQAKDAAITPHPQPVEVPTPSRWPALLATGSLIAACVAVWFAHSAGSAAHTAATDLAAVKVDLGEVQTGLATIQVDLPTKSNVGHDHPVKVGDKAWAPNVWAEDVNSRLHAVEIRIGLAEEPPHAPAPAASADDERGDPNAHAMLSTTDMVEAGGGTYKSADGRVDGCTPAGNAWSGCTWTSE